MNFKKINPVLDSGDYEPFAIVLSGGGAAGRWQAGVLTALSQAGVTQKASVIIGTSVGGLNAALFSAYGRYNKTYINLEEIRRDAYTYVSLFYSNYNWLKIINDPEELKKHEHEIQDLFNSNKYAWMQAVKIWEDIKKNEDVYKGSTNLFSKIGAFFGFLFNTADSVLDASPLRNRIDEIFKALTFENLFDYTNQHLVVSALDLTTHREEFYCSFDTSKSIKIAEALKRTSAIPIIFSSVPGLDSQDKEVHWHVDGGVGANNPFVALNKYNQTFPDKPLRKTIIIYCYPDTNVDIGTNIVSPKSTKRLKTMKEVLFETIPATLNTQEYITELIVEDKVVSEGWDVLALYPKETPCDSLDFTKVELLQQGYDYVVTGKGYSYKDKAEINILDFLTRKNSLG